MVHRPKLIQSNVPYGSKRNTLITTRVSNDMIITSEFWDDSPRPLWEIGNCVIARKGYTWKTKWELEKHFVVRQIYTDEGRLAGSYWNICSSVQLLAGAFAYEDWYLDVWSSADGKQVLLDETELSEALEKKYISLADADTAKWTAFRILELLE